MDGKSSKSSGGFSVEDLLCLVYAGATNASPNAWEIAADAISVITDDALMLAFCTAAQHALTEKQRCWKRSPSLTPSQEETYLEIIIQGVGNAEQITPSLRLNLLLALSTHADRRMTKAGIIDALEILIGDVDDNAVIAVARSAIATAGIARYEEDGDRYIEEYATAALRDSRRMAGTD